MEREEVIRIVSEVMNILEVEHDIDDLESLGYITAEEIADQIIKKRANVLEDERVTKVITDELGDTYVAADEPTE